MPQDSELREKGRLRYSAFFHMSACLLMAWVFFFAMNRNKLAWDWILFFPHNFSYSLRTGPRAA